VNLKVLEKRRFSFKKVLILKTQKKGEAPTVVMDWYSRYVLSWEISMTPSVPMKIRHLILAKLVSGRWKFSYENWTITFRAHAGSDNGK